MLPETNFTLNCIQNLMKSPSWIKAQLCLDLIKSEGLPCGLVVDTVTTLTLTQGKAVFVVLAADQLESKLVLPKISLLFNVYDVANYMKQQGLAKFGAI